MADSDFAARVQLTSSALAFVDYQRKHPAASAEQAHRHAERFWRQYVPKAIDFMAITDAEDEAQAAAPWN